MSFLDKISTLSVLPEGERKEYEWLDQYVFSSEQAYDVGPVEIGAGRSTKYTWRITVSGDKKKVFLLNLSTEGSKLITLVEGRKIENVSMCFSRDGYLYFSYTDINDVYVVGLNFLNSQMYKKQLTYSCRTARLCLLNKLSVLSEEDTMVLVYVKNNKLFYSVLSEDFEKEHPLREDFYFLGIRRAGITTNGELQIESELIESD